MLVLAVSYIVTSFNSRSAPSQGQGVRLYKWHFSWEIIGHVKAKLQLMTVYREPLITRREMPSVRKIHHWTETVSCRDENMPQDQFAGYINTEEAADCAAVQLCRLRRYERWMISGLSLRLRWARLGTRHQATHPHPQSQECEILEREVGEASLNLKALSFDATSPKSPTNYQLTTVGWLPSNVVAARGQNTFVSKINNLDLRYF